MFSDGARMDELSERFCSSQRQPQKVMSKPVGKDGQLLTGDPVSPAILSPSRTLEYVGMENKRSNCCLNCVLQCLFVSPLQHLILRFFESSEGVCASKPLLCALGSTFKRMITTGSGSSKRVPQIRLRESPMAIAKSVGMIPSITVHHDANEFFVKLFCQLCSEVTPK